MLPVWSILEEQQPLRCPGSLPSTIGCEEDCIVLFANHFTIQSICSHSRNEMQPIIVAMDCRHEGKIFIVSIMDRFALRDESDPLPSWIGRCSHWKYTTYPGDDCSFQWEFQSQLKTPTLILHMIMLWFEDLVIQNRPRVKSAPVNWSKALL
jgi:hypothetical protein